jgi:hypothetical protein
MRTYVPDQDLTIEVLFQATDGSSVTSDVGTWRLTDAEGVELLAPASLGLTPSVHVDRATVVVPAIHNAIPTGEPYAARIIEVTLTIAAGQHRQAFGYVLQPVEPLIVGVNSFQSIINAEVVATMLPGVESFKAAARADKVAAMAFAREQLCQLEYRIEFESQSHLIVDHPVVDGRRDLSSLLAADLANLPADFLKALNRAQVIQANYLLGGEEAAKMRDEGVLSTTVGESSTMFRGGMKPIEYPVSRRVVSALARYLQNPFACRIARS